MDQDQQQPTNQPGNLLIQEEMKSCYLDYAMSVIVGRALPDARDGLKPVHRRVLYAMHVLNNYHNRPYMKSARVVGEVIGKYHPHGDSSVYGAIVRLAQDFSMRYPIVDGQGNFGSMDGDNAAAMRYTEVRMDKLAQELLKDIEKNTVGWQPNYDGSLKEPTLLPTKIPNLLINGSTGIAVGMATNVPPHNISEVMNGLLALLKNPDLNISDLMNIIPGPDFPTAGLILGQEGIRSAFHKGRGIIQIRARTEIEVVAKTNRERIVVTEIPYQVNKAKLIEKIALLVNNKDIIGISDIRDESNRLGVRIVVDIKKGEMANVILNQLFKHTQLQVSFGIIFLAIHNGRPKVMNLKEMLFSFIGHRREIVVRRTKFDLAKARERAHILEGLKLAVENIDEVINLIKSSSGPSVAKEGLRAKYPLSERQAQAILDMRLQRLTGLEIEKIVNDYKVEIKKIEEYEKILATPQLVDDIIEEEFKVIVDQYGDERRTEIVAQEDEILVEDLIKQEEVFITVTHRGYVKRMALDTYKSQRRGGKGVKGADMDGDFYSRIFTTNTHSTILFFTNKGTVFSLKAYQIPEGARTAKGRNIINLLQVPKNEMIKEIVPLPSDLEGKYLIMATMKGNVKKSLLSDYKNVKQNGIRGIKVLDDDSVVSVQVTDGQKDILLCTGQGKIIRFAERDARPMGRVSQGVRGISLESDDKVIGMEIIDDTVEILSVTEKGLGKRTLSKEYRKQSRGGKGILAMKLTEKTGKIVAIRPVTDKDELMVITDKGQVIRTKISEVALLGRATQGVRVITLKGAEKVSSIEKLAEPESEPETETDEDSE